MNLKPNISGISRYWKEGEDDRREVAKSLGLKPDNRNNRKLVVFFFVVRRPPVTTLCPTTPLCR